MLFILVFALQALQVGILLKFFMEMSRRLLCKNGFLPAPGLAADPCRAGCESNHRPCRGLAPSTGFPGSIILYLVNGRIRKRDNSKMSLSPEKCWEWVKEWHLLKNIIFHVSHSAISLLYELWRIRFRIISLLMLLLQIHCKKGLAVFPSPAGMSLTKLSLGGKNLNFSRPGRV